MEMNECQIGDILVFSPLCDLYTNYQPMVDNSLGCFSWNNLNNSNKTHLTICDFTNVCECMQCFLSSKLLALHKAIFVYVFFPKKKE